MMERMAKQLIAKVAQSYSNKPLEVCLGNNSPILTLTCQECGLVKKSAEEMEVHIKVEHINWLPFKCPHCKTHRASDAMMREHIHAAHKQSAKEYIYVDNLEAKRKLQNLLDQSLYATVSKKIGFVEENYESAMSPEASTAAHSTTSSDSPPGEPSSPRVPFEIDGATAKVEIRTGGNANTDAILASITQAATGGHSQEIHEEETDPLIALLKSYQRDKTEVEIEGELKEDHNQSFDLAGNLSIIDSLFGKGGLSESSFSDSPNRKNVTTQLSKKKLVGYCKGCTKPVTAGARQMHLFYHLAKDYLIFRFFCKFDGCTIEHYRKDQMEHHMTKVHGQVIPELIGDRTDELYHKSKELQQELLGEMPTTNSGSSDPPSTPLLKRPAPQPATHPPDDKQTLQCNICKKYMENRVKGFHILHHLAKDNGILRYTCKLCDFAHDRSQSVLGHGKKEHGREDVVLDRIADYEDEVQEMSQKCFGFDTNFETSKKKARGSVYISKMPKGDVDENTSENDDQSEAVGSPEHNQELEDEAEEME